MTTLKVKIDFIGTPRNNEDRVVILREEGSEKALPVWISINEAEAILEKLENKTVPRPSSHDFACSIIEALGADVKSITISDFKNDIFYAKMMLSIDGEEMEMDCRPSDALAIAVRAEVPILVEEYVMNKCAEVSPAK